MKERQDYVKDLAEIRSMMERSSKFLSLSGLAGVMAGVYALAGAWIAYSIYGFVPGSVGGGVPQDMTQFIIIGLIVLLLAIGTAIAFSYRKAAKRGETIWNVTSKHLLTEMSVPLFTGGVLILILIANGYLELVTPLTLIFYGLALYIASKYSYEDVKYLGLMQVGLGLLGAWFPIYGLLLWAIGFGVIHIIYGIYIYTRYER